jgi:hypothetical protein
MVSRLRIFCLVFLVVPGFLFADPAPFDLAGPKLEVKVIHAGKTLPISEVPNLSVGDQVSIKADLPPGQSVHYLLVAAFLRGATNPPPEDWFFSSETWNAKGSGGLKITVPKDAQQVLVFLAPETGGDFKTLVGAVRGRPGAFVRASQDLNQATLDRSRLKVYLAAIQTISQTDFDHLKTASPLLARSLSIKFNSDCLQKIPELQAPCLMQGQDALILNDGHSNSIVQALTSGPTGDLAFALSSTPQAGFGYSSPYIASAMDIARIMESFRTAQYQYIPALATEEGDRLSLELNSVPSFQNPKSVLVVALPAVEAPLMPPLHPVDPKEVYCAEKTELVLPAEGAPLVFSTGYAHDMVLRLKGKNGKFVDLPVKADAEKGGFVANTAGLSPTNFGDALDGSLHGYWGFEPYNGPEFKLENTRPQHWQLVEDDQQSLIAGRDDLVHIETENAACVDSILLQKPTGETVKADWKSTGPNQVAVTLPLKKVKPGTLKLLVKEYGNKEPDTVLLQAFAQASHLDSFTLHAGDLSGVLKGSHLEDVKELTLNGVRFKPAPLPSTENADELPLITSDVKAANVLKEGEASTARVVLNDGRILSLETTVASPRPKVTLIGKSAQPSASSTANNLQLADPDELPQSAQLTFSIHAQVPVSFSGEEKIEVGTVHGAYLTTLTLTSGLTLEDSQVAVATLDTGKAFAASAYGPLRFRVIENGVASDWQPLATLVRLPLFGDLKCPDSPDQLCKLTGSKLFLVDSVSNDPQFTHPIQVPEGFPGYVLPVPHPIGGQLYVKLHDDPSIVNSVVFPAEGLPSSAGATSAASQKPQSPSSSPSATGAQAGPSSGTSARPTAAKQDAVAPPLPKPSTTGDAAPAPAPDKTTPQSAPSSAPPAATQTPQSSTGAAPSGSSSPSPPQGQMASQVQPGAQRTSSTGEAPSAASAKTNSPLEDPK